MSWGSRLRRCHRRRRLESCLHRDLDRTRLGLRLHHSRSTCHRRVDSCQECRRVGNLLVAIFDVTFIRDVVAITVGTDAFKDVPIVECAIVVAVHFAGVRKVLPFKSNDGSARIWQLSGTPLLSQSDAVPNWISNQSAQVSHRNRCHIHRGCRCC